MFHVPMLPALAGGGGGVTGGTARGAAGRVAGAVTGVVPAGVPGRVASDVPGEPVDTLATTGAFLASDLNVYV